MAGAKIDSFSFDKLSLHKVTCLVAKARGRFGVGWVAGEIGEFTHFLGFPA